MEHRRTDAEPPPSGILTLLTDFGTVDSYVASMKGVILSRCPTLCLVDLTHQVPPHDILRGALVLSECIFTFPPGTVHVAVVDPGVGTARLSLVAVLDEQVVVAPDNGLVAIARRRSGSARFHRLERDDLTLPAPRALRQKWVASARCRFGVGSGSGDPRHILDMPQRSPGPEPARSGSGRSDSFLTERPSSTFHGRDVYAPVGASLAMGAVTAASLGPAIEPLDLAVPAPRIGDRRADGSVVGIDRFGNLTTTVPGDVLLPAPGVVSVRVGGVAVERVVRTYGEAPAGAIVALVGSSGLVEVAQVEGSAARTLGVERGAAVEVTW